LTGPAFQDGSKPLSAVAVWASAEVGRSGPYNAGSEANVESRTRRLIPEERGIELIFECDAVAFTDLGGS
jgi:hypothetical protein